MDTKEETPKERTKRMLEELRQKTVNHDRDSRANQGKSIFTLRQKMKVTLPLVALVFGLFGASYFLTKRVMEAKRDSPSKDFVGSVERVEEILRKPDDEFLDDSGKNW